MKKIVSIIIPAYNSEKWIAKCIESAVNQSYPHTEIFVVDDSSKDSTFSIAQSFASPHIKIVKQDFNSGASAARNRGLSFAQGDYIQWLDSDDILHPDKIAHQMDSALSDDFTPTNLYSSKWGKFYHCPEKARFNVDLLWEDLLPIDWLLRKMEFNLWGPPMVYLVSRHLHEKAGPWNNKLSLDDDGDYFRRIIYNSTIIKFVSEAQCYKRSTFGLSHHITLNNEKCDSLANSLLAYVETLRSLRDDRKTREICLKFLNRWTHYFYPERMDLFQDIQEISTELGGRLEIPKVKSKFRWIEYLFGYKTAKKTQSKLRALRLLLEMQIEKYYYRNKQ